MRRVPCMDSSQEKSFAAGGLRSQRDPSRTSHPKTGPCNAKCAAQRMRRAHYCWATDNSGAAEFLPFGTFRLGSEPHQFPPGSLFAIGRLPWDVRGGRRASWMRTNAFDSRSGTPHRSSSEPDMKSLSDSTQVTPVLCRAELESQSCRRKPDPSESSCPPHRLLEELTHAIGLRPSWCDPATVASFMSDAES
jgi:hypothetical protein